MSWQRLAGELGFGFAEADNERLKGVSRMNSLEILLEIGGVALEDDEKEKAAARKNAWYVESLFALDEAALLPGADRYIASLADMLPSD